MAEATDDEFTVDDFREAYNREAWLLRTPRDYWDTTDTVFKFDDGTTERKNMFRPTDQLSVYFANKYGGGRAILFFMQYMFMTKFLRDNIVLIQAYGFKGADIEHVIQALCKLPPRPASEESRMPTFDVEAVIAMAQLLKKRSDE
ncbi:MAG: hypothetical protein IAG10_24915 [Planctomycetaceae bacterium]|nr:hypothetical protein [Planctomycetaceae bacterium]